MNFRLRTRQLAVGMATLALVTAGMGCGKNRVTVDVDVTSFIAPDDLTNDYQSPSIPFTVNLEPIEISLLEGSENFVNAEELSLDVAISYDNDSGDGDASFTLFFADTAANLFNTAAVVTIPAQLISGEITASNARFDADARVLDLFTRDHVFMGITFTYEPTGSSTQLAGTYTITSLLAHVVSNVEIF